MMTIHVTDALGTEHVFDRDHLETWQEAIQWARGAALQAGQAGYPRIRAVWRFTPGYWAPGGGA